jgi:hypothetical protein
MTITFPVYQQTLPQQISNFIALQSAKLSVTNSSASITFTAIQPGIKLQAKITNSGTKGAYLASGAGSATAVASSGTPAPASGTPIVANCDYIAAGSILTQDFIPGTDTLAAICAGSDSTTLEISIGLGQ